MEINNSISKLELQTQSKKLNTELSNFNETLQLFQEECAVKFRTLDIFMPKRIAKLILEEYCNTKVEDFYGGCGTCSKIIKIGTGIMNNSSEDVRKVFRQLDTFINQALEYLNKNAVYEFFSDTVDWDESLLRTGFSLKVHVKTNEEVVKFKEDISAKLKILQADEAFIVSRLSRTILWRYMHKSYDDILITTKYAFKFNVEDFCDFSKDLAIFKNMSTNHLAKCSEEWHVFVPALTKKMCSEMNKKLKQAINFINENSKFEFYASNSEIQNLVPDQDGSIHPSFSVTIGVK